MTVVAWDGKTLSADKRTSFGGLHATTTKLHRVGAALVSGSGSAALIKEMVAWVGAGCDPDTFPALQRDEKTCCSFLVVNPSGPLLQYDQTPYPLTIENKQWAIGSGRDFAMMAMHLGKTSAEAVELTSLMCSDCGNGVDSMEHE